MSSLRINLSSAHLPSSTKPHSDTIARRTSSFALGSIKLQPVDTIKENTNTSKINLERKLTISIPNQSQAYNLILK